VWVRMSKSDTPDPRLYDVRNLERNIRAGLLTRRDYEKYTKTLPDTKDKASGMPELPRRLGGTGAPDVSDSAGDE
jgi:hypothetical protein